MKRIILLTAILTALVIMNTSCTKTEIEYVDRVVTDTVYVDKIITEYDTVYIDNVIETSQGVADLQAAFEPYNTNYPQALIKAKELIKQNMGNNEGMLIYFGRYNYTAGYNSAETNNPIVNFLIIEPKEIGKYNIIIATQYLFNNNSQYNEGYRANNPAGLPAPQADFSKNTFAAYISKADLDLF